MTEHLPDLRQAPARAEHLGRGRVPQPMSADRPAAPPAGRRGARSARPHRMRDRSIRRAQPREHEHDSHRGRPRSSQPASASPTSAGNGRRSWRLPLPRTIISPARQSMSTAAARRPRRRATPAATATSTIAKSLRPTRVRRSQPANSRATDPESNALTSPASRQPATDGTASARSRARSHPPRAGTATTPAAG